jgi:hypothetical protein
MRYVVLFAALLTLVWVGSTQDFAPGVVMLARIKSHMREEAARLPNYTCLETIDRFHKEPDRAASSREALKPLDRVRLEVVYSDHREWFGSPGDSKIGTADPSAFVGSGLIGTGVFASMLNNVLAGAIFEYRGDDPLNGRAAFRYDFQYPRQSKGFDISMEGGAGPVGEKGSLWVDPKSLDLIRLEANAQEIPAYLPLAASGTTVNYARTGIGDSSVLLPQQATMQLAATTGVENYDHIEFTHCRAFSAESAISFDAPADAPADVPASTAPEVRPVPGSRRTIPANLQVTVELTTPISSRDVVGQLITGKVVGDVTRKGTVVIPHGATVRGRMRRLERYQGNERPAFIVGLEFTDVDASGGAAPFYADILRMEPAALRAKLTERVAVHDAKGDRITEQTITLADLPGVASFFVTGDTFSLPTGLRTVWRTRGPIH